MSYELRVDDRDGIVEIRFFGRVRHSEHLSARDELLDICHERRFHKVLVDVRDLEMQGEPSTTELFEFGASWPDLRKGMSVLLAGVLPRGPKSKTAHVFSSSVPLNRGFFTQGFDDPDDARMWLRHHDR
jgi:hypothetical protein